MQTLITKYKETRKKVYYLAIFKRVKGIIINETIKYKKQEYYKDIQQAAHLGLIDALDKIEFYTNNDSICRYIKLYIVRYVVEEVKNQMKMRKEELMEQKDLEKIANPLLYEYDNRLAFIDGAIALLEPLEQEIFIGYHLDNLTIRELAIRHNMNWQAMRRLYHKVKDKVAKNIKDLMECEGY